MAIVPRDLLAQAEDLLKSAEEMPDVPEREALLRTAVSRAYYSVYHEALNRARREGYRGAPPEYGSHEGLWAWWFVVESPAREIADDGDRLREERTRADYRLRETLSLTGARMSLEVARTALDLIRAL